MFKLNKLNSFSGRSGPLLLIVMDGVGIGKKDNSNAVYVAEPKNLIELEKEAKEKHLFIPLQAHGTAVGLPTDDDMGNSEVGHNALGAGKIIYQGAKLVNKSIKEGKMFETDLWKKLTDQLKEKNKTAHFIGLLSDGNVHSHIEQLFGILDGLAKSGVKKARIHTLLDGRDVPSKSALKYIDMLNEKLREIESKYEDYDYRIASGGGRMYVTMDRYESDWQVVKRGWDAHVRGVVADTDIKDGYKGYYKGAKKAIEEAREIFPEINDQTNPPFVIVDEDGNPVGRMEDGDVVINFNFRGDRAIQISKAFEFENFTEFDREYYPDVEYAGLLEYDDEIHLPKQYLVIPPEIKNTLSDYLCAQDISQYAIAETHKFGHVTYFWNGNRTGYVCPEKETYLEIKSEPSEMIPKNPKMKAYEVCDQVEKVIRENKYKFVRVNFANGDMVGHTGEFDATVIAVKTVDECVGRLVRAVNEMNGITLITADHGNADDMLQKDGSAKTAHSLNPVQFIIVDENWNNEYEIDMSIDDAGLTNVASTVINLLGFEKPEDYRASLIKYNLK